MRPRVAKSGASRAVWRAENAAVRSAGDWAAVRAVQWGSIPAGGWAERLVVPMAVSTAGLSAA